MFWPLLHTFTDNAVLQQCALGFETAFWCRGHWLQPVIHAGFRLATMRSRRLPVASTFVGFSIGAPIKLPHPVRYPWRQLSCL